MEGESGAETSMEMVDETLANIDSVFTILFNSCVSGFCWVFMGGGREGLVVASREAHEFN